MNKLSRIEEEKQTIEQMIHFYCRHKEKNQTLCSACSELLKYAHQRLEHCPFGERKKTCRQCTVHCYHPKMRQKIKEVMRFAGPRMIWYHPIWTLKHLWRPSKYRKIMRTPQTGENAGKKLWYATAVSDREMSFEDFVTQVNNPHV